jgi:hypothetical protein
MPTVRYISGNGPESVTQWLHSREDALNAFRSGWDWEAYVHDALRGIVQNGESIPQENVRNEKM